MKLFENLLKRKPGFYGNYKTWLEAQRDSSGYDSANILAKVTSAMLQVRDGKARYERDSVLFDTIEYSWPLLAALLWIASQERNHLRVIDFGGALGSSYYQNRSFLTHLETLNWNVVEQDSFLECGIRQFTDSHLRFFPTIDACIQNTPCDAIIFSSVLPYLPDPYVQLDDAIGCRFRYIIIDRTPVLTGRQDRLTVQVVPPGIYTASYPAWFLGEDRLIEYLSHHYELIAPFDSLVPRINLGDVIAREKGYIFKRKELV